MGKQFLACTNTGSRMHDTAIRAGAGSVWAGDTDSRESFTGANQRPGRSADFEWSQEWSQDAGVAGAIGT